LEGPDLRILKDRRKKSTHFLSPYTFFGRRKGFRRKVDQERGGPLDQIILPRIPIRVKLSVAIIFIIWLTILILSFVILARQKEQLYLQTVNMGKMSLNYFGNNASIPLLNDDWLTLNRLIRETGSVEGLLYAFIVDRNQVIKAHTDSTKIGTPFTPIKNKQGIIKGPKVEYFSYTLPSGKRILNLVRPITLKEKTLGEIHVGISLDFINQLIRKETISIILLSLFIILLGIGIAVLLGIEFSRPISKLVLATQEIGKGNFQHRLEMVRKDEFGDLATAFNYMAKELWDKLMIQNSFGRYVSPEVLNMILSHPEDSWLKGTRNEATILFTDVRGFTAYSEKLRPEEVVEDLNEYFAIATQCILEQGGYVDKFIGDAVLGVFGVPITHSDHALRALKATVAMQKEFIKRMETSENPLLSKVGIAINSGVVVAGTLGSQVKMEYTVIGDSVNMANRLNHLAGPGEIIISKSVLESTKDLAAVEPLPPQLVKGKSGRVEAFKVIGLQDGLKKD
jgi:adenylate cyclase